MKIGFQNNFIGYFRFYYGIIGNMIFANLLLCIFVSILDGVGLTMFIPLLQAVSTDPSEAGSANSIGMLHYVIDGMKMIGLEMNLNTLLILLVVLFVFKGIVKYIQLTYQVKMRYVFMKRVRYMLVDRLHNLEYSGFLKMDAGKIQNTLIAEVQRLFQTMNFYFYAAQACVMLITYITLAFLANYQFALFVAIGAGLTNLFYRKIYKSTKAASRELSKKGDHFNSYLIQAVHNFKYLKATNYFVRFEKRLKIAVDDAEKINRKIGNNNAISISLKEPMIIVIVALVIFLQINYMGANLATILLSLLLFYRALIFLVTVQTHWQNFVQNSGAIYSVAEFIDEMGSMGEKNTSAALVKYQQALTITDMSFSYGEKKILQDINLSIPKNSTVALVGESGSGKTTLANIIAGLVKPQKGKIAIDDTSLSEIDINNYRSKIGYISQEPVIFNDTVFNNITFWDEPSEANMKRFWEIVELASLAPFINNLPEREKSELGDNGSLVSGGQKQRISIARELYKNIEILILDEATSALDSETEKVIQENIEKLHGSYTMVIIAHRLSTIKEADMIYLLNEGKIASSGNFGKMLESSDQFKKMVSLQEI